MNKTPIRVAVTGAAGAIGYSILFRIVSGEVFGPDQPVILNLVDIPDALPILQGVIMELEDCASPAAQQLVATSDLEEGFRGIHWALLIGSVSRKPGMERKDLLAINGKIFTGQGRALQKSAAKDVRILVVGNPCNTNCLIAMAERAGDSARTLVCHDALGRKPRQGAIGQKGRRRHRRRFQSRRLGQSQPDHVPRFYTTFFKINGTASDRRRHPGRELAQDGICHHRGATRHSCVERPQSWQRSQRRQRGH